MGQVPHYTLFGDGKMSKHFSHYLMQLNIPHTIYSRSQLTAETIQKAHEKTDKICLLISDSFIKSFLDEHNLLYSEKIVHFSGSLVIDGCYSAHPLMSFTNQIYSNETYLSFPFIIEAEGPEFNELLPGIPNQHFSIPRELKPLYHAYCVMSGNFSCLLWKRCLDILQKKLNLPNNAVFPYMRTICQNLENQPDTALTGPLARKDLTTIEMHQAILKQEEDPFFTIYQAFIDTYIENSREPLP